MEHIKTLIAAIENIADDGTSNPKLDKIWNICKTLRVAVKNNADIAVASNWVAVEVRSPICYKTGDWDGKNSDQVIAEDKAGKKYLAHFCEGIIDGSKYKDWYDSNGYLIDDTIIRWLPLPE